MKRLTIFLVVVIVSAMLIDFAWTSFNTFSMEVAPTHRIGAYIVKSDLHSQGDDCLHYYIYQVETKLYTGSFRIGLKDCEYKHKIREKIIIKYLLHRPWVSRYLRKDFDNEETQVPLYVDLYLKNLKNH